MRQQIFKPFISQCKRLLVIQILSSFSHISKFSGETALFVAEVYHQGAESWSVRWRRITINIKCTVLCQQGELALNHKDTVQSDEAGGLQGHLG